MISLRLLAICLLGLGCEPAELSAAGGARLGEPREVDGSAERGAGDAEGGAGEGGEGDEGLAQRDRGLPGADGAAPAADRGPGAADRRPGRADRGPDRADRGPADQGVGPADQRPPPPDQAPPVIGPGEPPPPWIGVVHGTAKLRPDTPLPEGRAVSLDAARNEFEAAQLVVAGGAAGRRITGARPSALTGPGGAVIPADAWVVYQVGLFNVPSASNLEGAAGLWPDPLIPDVDPYFQERRRAFPIEVAAHTVRAVWVDLLVPQGAAPGAYAGEIELDVDGVNYRIPVSLRVRGFSLPSTATLPTAFGMGWNDACTAHHGGYEACGQDPGVERFKTLYARFMLDHRISIEQVVYAAPPGDDWRAFDRLYGPLLDGSDQTRLRGARLTTIRTTATNAEQFARWARHFQERGWMDRLFQYTCDEPPHGCLFNEIPGRAELARPAGVRTLVTTDLATATRQGVIDVIDILVPILQVIHQPNSPRDQKEAWRNADPGRRRLWWYQSCMSHGCGRGCETTPTREHTGWPSYVIDASAVQARAMEWLSFRYQMGGELYFQTTHMLPTAWEDQCDFSGAGDGTLLYPGTPDRIGGRTHIPIGSQRLMLIREGFEDYEYLHLLETLGEGAFARAQVDALFPAGRPVTDVDGDRLLEVRRAMADRIEARQGQ